MKKVIIPVVVLLLLVNVVWSANYDYFYNPYTGKPDRSLKVNQSGENSTFDYLFIVGINPEGTTLNVGGPIITTDNITASWFLGIFNWFDISKYLSFNGTALDFNETELNDTIDIRAINVGENVSSLYINEPPSDCPTDAAIIGYGSNFSTSTCRSYATVVGDLTVGGILNVTNNTFIQDNLTMGNGANQGSIGFNGTDNVITGDWIFTGMIIANKADPVGVCNVGLEGAIVYNSTSRTFLGCNSSTWNLLG